METKNLVFTGRRFDWTDVSNIRLENEGLVTLALAAARKIRSAVEKPRSAQRGDETLEYEIR